MNNDEDDSDRAVEVHRMKRLIKGLTAARGHGTSMVSLIIPPKDQISRVVKMLADEFGTASNIKSRVNRQSVLSAITSTQQRLKLYSKVPPNGLVIYCGTIVTENNKEKEVTIDLEPFKPINTSLVRPPRLCHYPVSFFVFHHDARGLRSERRTPSCRQLFLTRLLSSSRTTYVVTWEDRVVHRKID
jgi:eRF1 domain 1